ncbi:MAG: hypothetical protein LBQ10_04875 [Desulfovibrio sp.]|nr:hypothetical protein [Desulfovibrio sp.]
MSLAFQTASRIIYGHGSVSELGAEVKRPGVERAAADARLMAKNPRQGTAKNLEALIREHF